MNRVKSERGGARIQLCTAEPLFIHLPLHLSCTNLSHVLIQFNQLHWLALAEIRMNFESVLRKQH
jgi:hypothetical protein